MEFDGVYQIMVFTLYRSANCKCPKCGKIFLCCSLVPFVLYFFDRGHPVVCVLTVIFIKVVKPFFFFIFGEGDIRVVYNSKMEPMWVSCGFYCVMYLFHAVKFFVKMFICILYLFSNATWMVSWSKFQTLSHSLASCKCIWKSVLLRLVFFMYRNSISYLILILLILH